jgi:hypothetical protein
MVLNGFAVVFLLINASLVFLLPRRWALLPLFLSVCYTTRAQGILLGPLHFTVIRLILLAGFLRVMVRGPHLRGRLDRLDRLMLAWAAWLLTSSLFHDDISGALVYRLGLVYDTCGIYFLVRAFCQSFDDLVQLLRMVALVLAPVGLAMLYEKVMAFDVFSILGGVGATPYIRQGHVRAQGPFSHAILAGTVGAVCLPLTVSLWKLKRKAALLGCLACLLMVYASTSSGPVMSMLAGIFALLVWRFRHKTRWFVAFLIFGYLVMDMVMKDPAYFILARIDITGGSTGWHRARLIQSAIEHLSEWWLAGTDYTRHWMASGVSWSASHSDITNFYIQMGVWAGLPLVTLFVAQLVSGLLSVGRILRQWGDANVPFRVQFAAWALGASLFAHVFTCISVSYFDQSYAFLYLTLAAIGSANSEAFVLQSVSEDTESVDSTATPGAPRADRDSHFADHSPM